MSHLENLNQYIKKKSEPRVTLSAKGMKLGLIKSNHKYQPSKASSQCPSFEKIPNLQVPTIDNHYIFDIKIFEIIKIYQTNDQINLSYIVRNKKTGQKYNAKTFNTIKNPKDEIFIIDINELINIKHPTIISLQGLSFKDFKGGNNFTIFTDYTDYTPLSDFLKKPHLSDLNNTKKQKILDGIARSMMILHKNHVIHRNLNPANILIDKDFKPHLTDFGLSKICSSLKDNSVYGPNYQVYIAPEGKDYPSYFYDVYSFGIIMYEILSGNLVYEELKQQKEDIKNGFKPKFDTNIKKEFQTLIEKCLSKQYINRPQFSNIYNMLTYECCLNDVDNDELSSYINEISVKNSSYKDNEPIMKDSEILEIQNQIIQQKLVVKNKCISCKQIIKSDDVHYYSGFSYHKHCLKCAICHKKIYSFDDFVCVTPGMFFCKDDYEVYQQTKKLPIQIFNEYHEKMINNAIDEVFDPIILQKYVEIAKNRPQEKPFIIPEMIEKSFQLNENYKYFVPTVTFHFEYPPNKINFNELIKILPKEMLIVNIEKGSTFLTIAFILTEEFEDEKKYQEIVQSIQSELTSLNGKSIVGNLLAEPVIHCPTDEDIKKFYSKKSVNILQSIFILDQIDFGEIKQKVREKLRSKLNRNYKFIYDRFDLFIAAENKVREDIINNELELVITGITIISNAYYKLTERIKNRILKGKNELSELFLYHGTILKNQYGIINKHFLMPDNESNINQRDEGYFGIGIYATDNIYYASMYNEDFQHLPKYQKGSILCCCAIYDPEYKIEINRSNDDLYKSRPFDVNVAQAYGTYCSFVGSIANYHPIEEIESFDSLVNAHEYLFGNEFQITPICSLTVIRPDYYILWIDEHKSYSKYSNLIIQNSIENVYYYNADEDGNYNDISDFVSLKERNKMKLVLSFENYEWGKKVLCEIRKIYYRSNFICIVFSENINHIKFAKEQENVLFTDDIQYLLEFVNIKMEQIDTKRYIEYATKLQKKHNVNFNINKNKLLEFKNHKRFK